MSLNNTPSSERLHIGIFGKRNAGKSSVVNAITDQDLAIVSDVKGTTTDPVLKAMELLPLGPVVIIDTPGLDDVGDLGQLRMQKAYQVLNKTDIAILVVDSQAGMTIEDKSILNRIKKKNIPYIVVYNKSDLMESAPIMDEIFGICISTKTKQNIIALKEKIASLAYVETNSQRIIGDLISPGDFVVLVIPIDSAAPKGRLILPQQQTVRDVLDSDAVSIVVKETDLKTTLATLGRNPKVIITDSQAFAQVSKDTPEDVLLTSFSILFARYKGNLDELVKGASMLDSLADGDNILVCEGCTHHRQCDDIGTVKLPRWISSHSKCELNFEFTSGVEFPLDISKYKLIIHCGGCMLNEREMKYRIHCAKDAGIPITNYGTAIAHMNGILERSLEIFK